jgi:8-oxo-dGTP diphosphatase
VKKVTAAVIIEDGLLLVARRGPGCSLPGYWELPGGKVEHGETIQECLARELREELEMRSRVGDVAATTTYHYAHGSFEMIALEVVRLSDWVLHVHDAVSWVGQGEIDDLCLAPADVELVDQIVSAGHWQRSSMHPG